MAAVSLLRKASCTHQQRGTSKQASADDLLSIKRWTASVAVVSITFDGVSSIR